MKRIFITIFFLSLLINVFAQNVSLDTLFIIKPENENAIPSEVLKFPIIKTGNEKIDKLINTDLKNRYTHNEYTKLSTEKAIKQWAYPVVYLDFEVTYLKNNIISLNISAEACGANCGAWTEYFTYNTQTGKYITIDDVIDLNSKLKLLIISDKDKQYEAQKKELKSYITDSEIELDEDGYEWALNEYESCQKDFKIKTFALHNGYLEIIEVCPLPNVIKYLSPTIELKYKFEEIYPYLKMKEIAK